MQTCELQPKKSYPKTQLPSGLVTWFETLTGIEETSGDDVRSKLRLDGSRLTSLENGNSFDAGKFTTPHLRDLRQSTEIAKHEKLQLAES